MPPRTDENSNAVVKRSHLETSSSSSSSSSSSPTPSSSILRSTSTSSDELEPEVANATAAGSSSSSSLCGPSHYYYYYLSPTAQYHLPRFQYKGQDNSLLYNYVLSPLAQWLVDNWVPTWVAPNTITLVGLLFMVSSYVIYWCLCPDLNSSSVVEEHEYELPRWIFLWNCVSMLLYQTFDNMDGKQARRTRSTSPLGLLFDHGCDAVNSLFGSSNWIIGMALNPKYSVQDSLASWILLLGPYALFFVGTWEEYYTGKLVLPIFNGPNEGLLGGALLSLTSCVYGPSYWQEYTWSQTAVAFLKEMGDNNSSSASFLQNGILSFRNADWVILASLIAFVQECLLKIGGVVQNHGWHTTKTLLPFLLLLGCSHILMVVATTTTTTTTATDSSFSPSPFSSLWITHPRTCLHLFASLFVEMTTALMLAHMSNTPYQAWRWILLPLVLLTAATVVMTTSTTAVTTTSTAWSSSLEVLWIWYAAASVTYLALKTCRVIHEICHLLHIWCFDITTPRRQQTTTNTTTTTTMNTKLMTSTTTMPREHLHTSSSMLLVQPKLE